MNNRADMLVALQKPAGYFANETFVVHQGKVISRYRKATYFDENRGLVQNKWVYFFGRGYDEPTEDGGTLAQELVKRVGTNVCRDVALSFKLWLHRLLSAQQDDEVRKRFFADRKETTEFITQKFNIRNFSRQDGVTSPFFKVRVIQSNIVGLSEYIDNFADGRIVVQSDPKVSGVFKIRWLSHVKDAIGRYKSENSGADPGWAVRFLSNY